VRRPIFWFLWPAAEAGPVDDAAVQSRWLRVCGRGPWRWTFLIACTAGAVTVISAAAAATLSRPGLLTAMLTVLIAVPVIGLLARAWVAGTYVCDRGVKVSDVITTTIIPWSEVMDVEVSSRSRLLGTPVRLTGRQVRVRWSGATTPTHVETASPDLWLRPQAFDAARDRLLTWHRETI
jgi:hypothetical protein